MQFSKDKTKEDGINPRCKACSKIIWLKWYEKNAPQHIKNNMLHMIKRRTESRKQILEYFLTHPCVDCGEKDLMVLEFDHLPKFEKKHAIANMLYHGSSWETILKEITKCEVVCANDHRRRTQKRSGSYRSTSLLSSAR